MHGEEEYVRRDSQRDLTAQRHMNSRAFGEGNEREAGGGRNRQSVANLDVGRIAFKFYKSFQKKIQIFARFSSVFKHKSKINKKIITSAVSFVPNQIMRRDSS